MNTPSRSGWFGSRRGVAPVAMHEPVERRCARRRAARRRASPTSSATARAAEPPVERRGRRRLACAARCRSGSPVAARGTPSRAAAGRTGRCGSAPIATMRPSKPSRRSVSAARSPASDMPTTTTVRIARGRYRSGPQPDAAVILAPRSPRHLREPPHARLPSSPHATARRLRPPARAAATSTSTRSCTRRRSPSSARRNSRRKPNTAMTRKFDAWARQQRRDVLSRCTPSTRRCSATRVTSRSSTSPATSTSRSSSPAAPIDTFEEVLQRKAKFAVIFAAGFSETGTEGEKLEQRLAELVHGGDVHLLGPNTNLNAFEDFRTDLDGPSIALITQSGHQGRPVFQGQEIGIRLTHWAPTGNEVDLEFADFARYFADQPEVGVDRVLHRGLQGRPHADARRRPRGQAAQADRDGEGRQDRRPAGRWRSRTPATSPAPTRSRRAVFRQFGVTRVDGLDELLEVSAAFARTQPGEDSGVGARRRSEPGVCVYAISGGTGAHMADMLADAGLRAPRSHQGDASRAARRADPRVPAGVEPGRLRRPAGRRPRAAARSSTSILADKNVDILIVPITGAVATFSEPFTRDIIEASQTTTKPIFVIWGAPAGTDDTYYKRLLDGGLPTFRTFNNCVPRSRPTSTTGRSPRATARRSPTRRPRRRPRRRRRASCSRTWSRARRCREWQSKQLLQARTASRRRKDVLCTSAAAAVRGRERDRLPGRDEGLVARPAAQDATRASCSVGVGVRQGGARRPTTTCLRKAKPRRHARRASRACSCARW